MSDWISAIMPYGFTDGESNEGWSIFRATNARNENIMVAHDIGSGAFHLLLEADNEDVSPTVVHFNKYDPTIVEVLKSWKGKSE